MTDINRQRIKLRNQLLKYELTIDTVLWLQGFKHNSKNGWLKGASVFNSWIKNEIDLLYELEDLDSIKSEKDIEVMTCKVNDLIKFAEIDILKNLCKIY